MVRRFCLCLAAVALFASTGLLLFYEHQVRKRPRSILISTREACNTMFLSSRQHVRFQQRLPPRQRQVVCNLQGISEVPNLWNDNQIASFDLLHSLSSQHQQWLYFSKLCKNSPAQGRYVTDQIFALPLSRATNLEEFLIQERKQRADWIKGACRYLWHGYRVANFGAPEIDVLTGEASETWGGTPMFVLDNLDTLALLGLNEELGHALRWLEIVTLAWEAATSADYDEHDPMTFVKAQKGSHYRDFRRGYSVNAISKKLNYSHALNSSRLLYGIPKFSTDIDIRRLFLEEIFEEEKREFKTTQWDDEILQQILENPWNTFATEKLLSAFEMTIRQLGGLVSGFLLTKHPICLFLAEDLGRRLATMFEQSFVDTLEVDSDDWCSSGKKFTSTGFLTCCAFRDRLTQPFEDCLEAARPWKFARYPFGKVTLYGSSAQYKTNCLAEVGSLSLEFKMLSVLTGETWFADAVDAITELIEIDFHVSTNGFAPSNLSKRSGVVGLDSMSDSYYEYLLKDWILTGRQDMLLFRLLDGLLSHIQDVFVVSLGDSPSIPVKTFIGGLSEGGVKCNVNSSSEVPGCLFLSSKHFEGWAAGSENLPAYGTSLNEMTHMACFASAMLGKFAQELATTSFGRDKNFEVQILNTNQTWKLISFHSNFLPPVSQKVFQLADHLLKTCLVSTFSSTTELPSESHKYSHNSIEISNHLALLRPEALESLYYMHELTSFNLQKVVVDPISQRLAATKYENWAWRRFLAFEKCARGTYGYGSVNDGNQISSCLQNSPTARPVEESWVLAESMKYLFLTFADDADLSLPTTGNLDSKKKLFEDFVFTTEAHPLPILPYGAGRSARLLPMTGRCKHMVSSFL